LAVTEAPGERDLSERARLRTLEIADDADLRRAFPNGFAPVNSQSVVSGSLVRLNVRLSFARFERETRRIELPAWR